MRWWFLLPVHWPHQEQPVICTLREQQPEQNSWEIQPLEPHNLGGLNERGGWVPAGAPGSLPRPRGHPVGDLPKTSWIAVGRAGSEENYHSRGDFQQIPCPTTIKHPPGLRALWKQSWRPSALASHTRLAYSLRLPTVWPKVAFNPDFYWTHAQANSRPHVTARWSCSVPTESRMPEVEQRGMLDTWQTGAHCSQLMSGGCCSMCWRRQVGSGRQEWINRRVG